MTVALGLCLAVSLLAAVSARRLAEWLPPRTATWLLAGGTVALAGTSSVMLGLVVLVVLAAALRTSQVAATRRPMRTPPRAGPAGSWSPRG
jgi:hypothetical protein